MAHRFLELDRLLSTKADPKAIGFARDMTQTDARALLRALVLRDDRILRLEGNVVRPGPAFQGGARRRLPMPTTKAQGKATAR
jgi:hypothetical protein